MKSKMIFYITVVIAAVLISLLWKSGVFGLWTDGMAHIANNTKEFTDKTGHIIEGNYSMEIDLSDLESNIGKEIYNDGEHRISVFWLQRTQNGGYDVGFRSSGQYSLSGATLISGLHHKTLGEHSFTTLVTSKMKVDYRGKEYEAQSTGQCGINYKNGDCFSFTFFLRDDPNEEPIEGTGSVKLTITDLYKNIWSNQTSD